MTANLPDDDLIARGPGAGLASRHDVDDAIVAATDVTAPSAPTSPAASQIIEQLTDGTQQITFVGTWTASVSADVVGYEVLFQKGAGPVVTIPVTGTRFERVGVKGGTTCNFQVQAIDEAGNRSAPTSPVTSLAVADDTTGPGPVVPVSFTAKKTRMVMTWTNPSDADLAVVQVWRNTTNATTGVNFTRVGNALAEKFTDETAVLGTPYWYWARTRDALGNVGSVFTALGNGTVIDRDDVTAPATPTGLALSQITALDGDGHQIATLAMTCAANSESDLAAYEFKVQRGSNTPKVIRTPDPYFEVDPAKIGTVYSVQVRAVDRSENKSAYTSPAATLTPANDTTGPGVVTGITSSLKRSAIAFAWTNPTDTDLRGIQIWRNTSNTTVGATKLAVTDGETFRDDTGAINTPYWYWARAIDTVGNTGSYAVLVANVAFVDPADQTAPATPTGLNTGLIAEQQADGSLLYTLNMSWTANTEADLSHYVVGLKKNSGGTIHLKVEAVSGITPYVERAAVKVGDVWTLTVAAVDFAGNRSAFANTSRTIAADTTPPAVISGTTATSKRNGISLAWANPADADFKKVKIYRSNISNVFATASFIGETASDHYMDDLGLSIGTTYWYWGITLDLSGNPSVETRIGSSSGTVFVDKADTTPPSSPPTISVSQVTEKNGDGTLVVTAVLTWGASVSTDVASYLIGFTHGGNYSHHLAGNTASYMEFLVKVGWACSWFVKAIDYNGNESGTVGTSLTIAPDATPPAVPTALAVTAKKRGIKLDWTNPTDPDLRAVQVWRNTVNATSGANFVKVYAGVDSPFIDATADAGVPYWYWARSIDLSGNASAYVQFSGSSLVTLALTGADAALLTTDLSDAKDLARTDRTDLADSTSYGAGDPAIVSGVLTLTWGTSKQGARINTNQITRIDLIGGAKGNDFEISITENGASSVSIRSGAAGAEIDVVQPGDFADYRNNGTAWAIFRSSSTMARVVGRVWLTVQTFASALVFTGGAAAGTLSNLGGEALANKGAASGYAPLNASSIVPMAYMPTGTSGNLLAVCNQANTWLTQQTFIVAPSFTDASGTRTALGLGTAATKDTGTSGGAIPLCNGNIAWTGTHNFAGVVTFGVSPVFTDVPGTRAALGLGGRTTKGQTVTLTAADVYAVTSLAFTAPRTWTLPLANTVAPGYEITIADELGTVTATNTLTLARQGSDTINGATSIVAISAAYGFCRARSDGTSKWTRTG